jgi:putative heme iron utilization protein
MNEERRKKLAEAQNQLNATKAIVEEVQGEEQNIIDNMPEEIQASGKGEKAQTAIDAMQEAIDAIEGAVENLDTASE